MTGQPHGGVDFVFGIPGCSTVNSIPAHLRVQRNLTLSFLSILAYLLLLTYSHYTRSPLRAERRRTMILVTGATGLNGRELLHRLAAKGVPARALVRNVTRAEGLSALPKVEIAVGDMAR